jgi:hypothetical protein
VRCQRLIERIAASARDAVFWRALQFCSETPRDAFLIDGWNRPDTNILPSLEFQQESISLPLLGDM